MALIFSDVRVELREVLLANKPKAMLKASTKGTVPVLQLTDGYVIDESLDIMHWALQQNDPGQCLVLTPDIQQQAQQLIAYNDEQFKTHLDHYKYHDRYPQHPKQHYRAQGEQFLDRLESRLKQQTYLVTDQASLADLAIFPFIRQFAHVDKNWFDQAPYPNLQQWLNRFLECDEFTLAMHKYPVWEADATPVYFP